jgi:TolB-like protein
MQTPSSTEIRAEVDRILQSRGFARNERLSAFLRFVVEQELSGIGDQLKESIIGVEVFGRRADYDVRQDSVVRTEASKLRDRLAKYYATDGANGELIVELPKGGYRPAIRERDQMPLAGLNGAPSPSGESADPHVHAPLNSRVNGASVIESPQESPVEPRSEPAPHAAGRLRVWTIGLAAIVVVALGAIAWEIWFRHDPIPVVVLPLLNVSQDPANEYFSDGLTAEIIRNLSIIDGLAVRSQTSSFAFKGKVRDAGEIGKQLGVQYIVEGSVLRSGQQLRVDAQLIRVRDDFPLWSGRYDRELTDIFAIQDEISRGIVNSLRLKLGQGRRRYETSAEAYDLYLRGRAALAQPLGSGVRNSVEPFEQAIAKDPTFAPAYAGLARARASMAGFDLGDRPGEMDKMRAAVEKAMQLDPLLPEAYQALGTVQTRDAQWVQAEKSFLRCIELDPNNGRAHGDYAMFLLLPTGPLKEALREVRIAQKMDPLARDARADLAYVLRSSGRFEESKAFCDPQSGCLAQALLGEDKFAETIAILEPIYVANDAAVGLGPLGYAYARAGRREDAEKLAATVRRPIEKAQVYAGLGDKDRTVAALDAASRLGPVRLGRALTFPEFAFVRDDARMRTLRKRVGLPD